MEIHSEVERVRDLIIDAIGRATTVWGVNQTLGRLYGLLYFAHEPLSLDEMAKELMVSKATVSINIRTLEGFKCVYKVWKKGSRKDYYSAERDFDKILQEVLRTNGQAELEIYKTAIAEALTDLDQILQQEQSEEIREQAESAKERIYVLAHWVQIGEKWMHFLLDNDISEDPKAPVRRIDVEWEDE